MMSKRAPAQPDLWASDLALRLPAEQVVSRLIELLGARLVAYLASVKDQRAVRGWAAGERPMKSPEVLPRLRTALHLALFLNKRDDSEVVQAWFQGVNPQLGDQVPLKVLRDGGDPPVTEAQLLAAARDFASR